jgi:hypothetical protein
MSGDAPDDDPVDVDVSQALTLRDPRVPVTLDDLAALRGKAVEVLEARVLILETARKRAIRMTHPEDWVLFKSPDERIVAYLQDCGCERTRDILSIEIFDVTKAEKIMAPDGQSYVYVQHGSGRSRLTLQTVEGMIGGRSSTDDFTRDATGAILELLVMKATRANLDGNIARELMGLKSVPIDELADAWKGTTKSTEHCRKGRGFGTGDERLGATREGVPDVPPPTCTVCKGPDGQPLPLVYREGRNGKGGFYGCRNYKQHEGTKVTVDAAKWEQQQRAKQPPSQAAAAPTQADLDEIKRQDAEILAREAKK